MSQKLYVLLLTVVTVSLALKCYKDEVKVGQKAGKDKLEDCGADVTKCNNYTLKYGDVDRMVFDCGPKQEVCRTPNPGRRRRDTSEKCDAALATRNVKSVMKDEKSQAKCTKEIYKVNIQSGASEETYLYCFNDVVWDEKQYMGLGKYDKEIKCEIDTSKAHKLPKIAGITLSSKADGASTSDIYDEGSERYTLMNTLYIICDGIMKLKESSMNSLKWDTGTKAWQFDGKTPDLADICEDDAKYKEIPKPMGKYTKTEDGKTESGVVRVGDKAYSEEATLYVICSDIQNHKDNIKKITFDTTGSKWKFNSADLAANTVLCVAKTCKATDFGMFTVYKDGAAAKDGVIDAVPLNDGTVDHGVTVYLKCKKKDYVDIFEADTNLHAYKCDATSTKDIKVMGEMFKECISPKDYECKQLECNTDGCNAAAQLHMAMASLLLTIAYILW